MRLRARRDRNEAAIVAALEAAGCTIVRLNERGVPDLLALRHGQLTLIEVKDGAKAPSRRRLTPEQVDFHARWTTAPLVILRSVEEAVAWVQADLARGVSVPGSAHRDLPRRNEGDGWTMSQEKGPEAYARQLTDAETLEQLREVVALYSELAVDAGWVVAKMTETDFREFRRGLKQERKGRFAGEAWARQFNAVLMPLPMFRIAAVAEQYHAPFSVAWQRLKDVRPDLLVVEPPSADAVDPHATDPGKLSTRDKSI